MPEFWIYFKIGLEHVLDLGGYDHVLFLIALTVPYTFREWTKILLLVTIFTVGHTLALLLSVFGVVTIKASLVEFMIPVTILITALYSLFTAGKSSKNNSNPTAIFITLFFGIIHGLGFSNYFNSIMPGNTTDKMIPLLEFALGIEVAQVIVVIAVLILAYIFQTFLRFNKRDWTLVMSAFVAGVVVPMIIGSEIWK